MAKNAQVNQPYPSGARPAPRPNRPYPVHPGATRPAQPRPNPQRDPIPVKKNKKKEREYFFIMKRGICFFIMIFALIWLAVFALSFVKVLPKFTSIILEPDRTPVSLREDVESEEKDEEGNPIILEYQDKTVFVGLDDMVYGSIAKLLKKPQVDAEGKSKSQYYDDVMKQIDIINGVDVTESTIEEEGTTEEEQSSSGLFLAGEEGTTEEGSGEEAADLGDDRSNLVSEDGMFKIGSIAATYFPIALLLGAILSFLIFLFAFLALFGRRIFRGFGIMALLLIVVGVFTLFGGLAISGIQEGAPKKDEETDTVVSIVNFSNIGSFLTGGFAAPPEEEPEVETPEIKAVGGVPVLVFVAVPVVILMLSFFTKKKVPYSIFDR